ncbi:MAG TPA: hypothetical protein VFV70_02020 [Hyphomonadaceae bacterium]|nr:hypothetical protein [Hyphomonadaceae bacterium]
MAYNILGNVVIPQGIADVSATQKLPLGRIVQAEDLTFGAGDFIYVQASNSITQYDAVVIKQDYKIAPLTITNGKLAIEVAFAQSAFADKGSYGWVLQGGRPMVRCANGTQPNVPLFATATGGVLDDVSSSVVIQGVQAETQVTNSAGPATCVVRFPTAHHEPPG